MLTGNQAAAGAAPTAQIPVCRMRLIFECESPYADLTYRGSAWRGILGGALKRLVCVTRERECPRCLLYRCCVYPYIFETPPPPGEEAKRYTAIPHPFVLETQVPTTGKLEQFRLGVSMFGAGATYAPYLVRALEQGARNGLRPENIPMRLAAVEQESPTGSGVWRDRLSPDGTLAAMEPSIPVAPAMPERVRIHLRTPLRLRSLNDLVTPERFTPFEFALGLTRRLSAIAKYHCPSTEASVLPMVPRTTEWLDRRVRWKEWTRYSSRQETKMKMGGLVGEATLSTEGLDAFWPLLWTGQYTFAGKATSMGLGRYDLEAL